MPRCDFRLNVALRESQIFHLVHGHRYGIILAWLLLGKPCLSTIPDEVFTSELIHLHDLANDLKAPLRIQLLLFALEGLILLLLILLGSFVTQLSLAIIHLQVASHYCLLVFQLVLQFHLCLDSSLRVAQFDHIVPWHHNYIAIFLCRHTHLFFLSLGNLRLVR